MRPFALALVAAVSLPAVAQSVPSWAAPSSPAAAQSDPSPPAPPTEPPQVPLDGGLALLAAAGTAYAVRRLRGGDGQARTSERRKSD